MNLLAIVQEFCKRTGIRQPSAAISSNDAQVLQLVALLNELLDEITMNYPRFSESIIEKTWTSTGVEIQGTKDSLFPGMLWLLPNSFFDRTATIRVKGPLTPDQWQSLKALSSTGSAYPSYRFIGTNLHIYPAVAVTQTLAVEYKTNYCVVNVAGTAKQYFTVDTDTPLLSTTIMLLGLRYKWKKEKGMNYLPEQDLFIKAIRAIGSQDGQKVQIDMSSEGIQIKPGVYIPDSNWPVT